MHTSSIELLEKSALPPEQARAIVKAMELELASSQAALVTRSEMAAEFALLRAEMMAEFAKIRGEIKALEGRIWGKTAVWVLTCTLSQTVVLLGVIYFLFAHFSK